MDIAKNHSEFLAEYAAELGYFYEVSSSDIDRTSEFLEWFAEKVFEHAYNHGVEDTIKAHHEPKTAPPVHERDKTYTRVPGEGWRCNQEDIMEEAGP